jgi:ketosteroid isomerase-like protein
MLDFSSLEENSAIRSDHRPKLKDMSDTTRIVHEFWRLMATNDFHAVSAVLSPSFVLEWPQSNERIRGATNFALLNTAYPANGPWTFTINRVVGGEHDAVSDVSVTDGVLRARAISFFSIAGNKIERIVEFWPEPYEPPFDRTQFVEPIN